MGKLSPIVLRGFTLDRATAVILLECWIASNRSDYCGGLLITYVDQKLRQRLLQALPIREFMRHWTPLDKYEDNRQVALATLIKVGLLEQVSSYAARDTRKECPIYYGVNPTATGAKVAADLKPLLPSRMDFTTFRQVVDLIRRYKEAVKAKRNNPRKPQVPGLLGQIDRLKTQSLGTQTQRQNQGRTAVT